MEVPVPGGVQAPEDPPASSSQVLTIKPRCGLARVQGRGKLSRQMYADAAIQKAQRMPVDAIVCWILL
jgi:predicted pyridoxine 5'-phosphate oxidase superfamily flavin-nucleotide-binding protein